MALLRKWSEKHPRPSVVEGTAALEALKRRRQSGRP
jgi:hypothetical protein